MILHLINGFLGSGKTTAIISATKTLMEKGATVGIVTNDKGHFQVDTAFFQSRRIPTRQVTGGCFRCSFSEFEEKIGQLQEEEAPDVIFAESVGSCVDLVNTIFSPLRRNTSLQVERTTYSVFADIRLFQYWVNGEPLPFSDAINYLFAKQMEEGTILVLNKADLLQAQERQETLSAAVDRYPGKKILLQDSRDSASLAPWLLELERAGWEEKREGFTVDYPTYKGGEQEMAWLDSVLTLEADETAKMQPALSEFIAALLGMLQDRDAMVGHIKFFLENGGEGKKFSLTTADLMKKPASAQWMDLIPEVDGTALRLTLNARAAMRAEVFSAMVRDAVERVAAMPGVQMDLKPGSAYNPEMSMYKPC